MGYWLQQRGQHHCYVAEGIHLQSWCSLDRRHLEDSATVPVRGCQMRWCCVDASCHHPEKKQLKNVLVTIIINPVIVMIILSLSSSLSSSSSISSSSSSWSYCHRHRHSHSRHCQHYPHCHHCDLTVIVVVIIIVIVMNAVIDILIIIVMIIPAMQSPYFLWDSNSDSRVRKLTPDSNSDPKNLDFWLRFQVHNLMTFLTGLEWRCHAARTTARNKNYWRKVVYWSTISDLQNSRWNWRWTSTNNSRHNYLYSHFPVRPGLPLTTGNKVSKEIFVGCCSAAYVYITGETHNDSIRW